MKPSKFRNIFNLTNIVLILFVIVCLFSYFSPFSNLDLYISQQIQKINLPLFQKLMWFISTLGNQPFMIVIVGTTSLLLYYFKFKVEAVISSLAAAGSALTGSLIKVIIDHPRPVTSQVHVSVWLSDKSFPSNHVLVFTVFFGFLLYLLLKKTQRKIKNIVPSIILVLLVSTIGISRIYLGAHWASDVLGGYLLGILWLMFTIRIYNSHNGKR